MKATVKVGSETVVITSNRAKASGPALQKKVDAIVAQFNPTPDMGNSIVALGQILAAALDGELSYDPLPKPAPNTIY